jgi:hypothetical protein
MFQSMHLDLKEMMSKSSRYDGNLDEPVSVEKKARISSLKKEVK